MEWFSSWWPAFLLALDLCLRLAVVVQIIMRGPRSSDSSRAWILMVVFLPLVGIPIWLLLGEARLGRRRRERYRSIADRVADQVARLGPIPEYRAEAAEYGPTIALAEAVGGTPPRSGNELELTGDSMEFIDRLADDIESAQSSCHLLFYIFVEDEAGWRIGEALKSAASRGVSCRLLLDSVGSRPFLRSRYVDTLRETGVEVVESLPANLVRMLFARVDLRNHRKIAVVDGRVGYTGSQNIAAAAYALKLEFAPWVDCMLRIRGPVVGDLQAIFVRDWFLENEEPLEALLAEIPEPRAGGVPVQILPTGPNNDNEALAQLALASFHGAQEELILTTPYFVPGEAEVVSLCTAAKRGVCVRLVVPARNDSPLVQAVSRSHYERLIDAGVEVFEYQEGLLHAKTLTVDRDLALVTTANFDRRSFDLNFEVSTLVYDSDFASQLRLLQRGYMQHSTRVTLSQVHGRSWLRRFAYNAAGIFSPVL